MANTPLIMALAKVIIAAAWADGEVTLDETNSLKDLLFRLPDMTARDWASLEIYIESPVDEADRARLIEELKMNMSSASDKDLVLTSLQELISADGNVTSDEQLVFEEIAGELDEVNVNLFGNMGRLLRGPVQRRSQALNTPNRELYLDDFIQNKIYYHLNRRLEAGETELDIPEKELRKLSLAGGLLARVAYVDRDITPGEIDGMAQALKKGWPISPQAANLVVDVATDAIGKNLDYYRLSRSFFECTTETERLAFTDALFEVAAGDGFATHNEIEEIRTIAMVLKLTHKQFIDAKLKIPSEKRSS